MGKQSLFAGPALFFDNLHGAWGSRATSFFFRVQRNGRCARSDLTTFSRFFKILLCVLRSVCDLVYERFPDLHFPGVICRRRCRCWIGNVVVMDFPLLESKELAD